MLRRCEEKRRRACQRRWIHGADAEEKLLHDAPAERDEDQADDHSTDRDP